MLTVDQYDYIRTAQRFYGKTIKEIARETGHSKNTVKKVLRGECSRYSPRKHQPAPIIGSYQAIIDQWLKNDKKAPRKQRHSACRVYNRLENEYEFSGAESTVRRYVRDAKSRLGLKTCAYIPLDPEPGIKAGWKILSAMPAAISWYQCPRQIP